MPEFGPVLRRFRKAAGLSQERLAVVSGVSVEAIKTLEAGRRRYPWVQTVDLLSDGLQLGVDERSELKNAAARPKASSPSGRLPADVADFVGRADQIAAATELLTGSGRAPGVVVISAIAGMGGVGKTALAVRVAHGLADEFADGLLFLNLRGFGVGEPMSSLEALSALLQQLGFALRRPPESAEEAVGLFRTACAGRKVLVVLDNAASVEQVLPLLPGASTCAVIVTSRRALVGLPGARPLELAVLPDDEALALLTSVAGAERIDADPKSALEVVSLCGSLPLALRIAGTRLATEPNWTVADLVRRLADETARLDVLAGEGTGVRASIALSLTGTSAQDAAAAEVFGLLGQHEGDELDLKVAARLIDRPEADVEPLLEHLVDLHLLESPGPRRYQFHDLVRMYAQELAASRTTAAGRVAARGRVMALYVAMVWRVRREFGLGALTRDWFEESWVSGTDELEFEEVMSWLDVETDEILAAAERLMCVPGPDYMAVVRLAAGIVPFWGSRRRDADGVRMGLLAVTALRTDPACAPPQALAMISYDVAQHLMAMSHLDSAALHATVSVDEATAWGYQQHQLFSLLTLGQLLERMDRLDESLARTQAGLKLALSTGDEIAQAEARGGLGVLAGRQGRWAEQDREFELANALSRQAGPSELGWLAETVSSSYRRCGRAEKALDWLRAAMDETWARSSVFTYADILQFLGSTEVELSAYDAARDHLAEALDLIGDNSRELEARIRHSLGTALSGLGESEPAREQWRLALDLYRRYGLPQADEVRRLLDG